LALSTLTAVLFITFGSLFTSPLDARRTYFPFLRIDPNVDPSPKKVHPIHRAYYMSDTNKRKDAQAFFLNIFLAKLERRHIRGLVSAYQVLPNEKKKKKKKRKKEEKKNE